MNCWKSYEDFICRRGRCTPTCILTWVLVFFVNYFQAIKPSYENLGMKNKRQAHDNAEVVCVLLVTKIQLVSTADIPICFVSVVPCDLTIFKQVSSLVVQWNLTKLR